MGMKVEHLYDVIEDEEDYQNDWEVMAEDGTNRRYLVVGHRVGVDSKGEPCLMLEISPE